MQLGQQMCTVNGFLGGRTGSFHAEARIHCQEDLVITEITLVPPVESRVES
jgi:hypothetical protein